MPALIVWITKTVARWWFAGDTDRAAGVVAWGFAIVAIVATGLFVHRFDHFLYRAEIAEIRAEASAAEAAQNRRVLLRERAERDALTARDNAYAQVSLARQQAAVESARLSGDLSVALARLRQRAELAAVGVPGTGSGADQCADLRAALGRAVGAMELLQAAGDRAAEDGQYAVDVATDAHNDALARETLYRARDTPAEERR